VTRGQTEKRDLTVLPHAGGAKRNPEASSEREENPECCD
jgi:hypothetical protein